MKYYFIEIIESLIIRYRIIKCLTNKTPRIKLMSNRMFG